MKFRSLFGILLVLSFNSLAQTLQLSIGNSTLPETFYDCKIDPSGGTIHVGIVTNAATGNDIFMVKLDAAHQVVWQKMVTNAGSDIAYNVTICANGDYIVTGEMTQSGSLRGFTSRVNGTNGNIIWTYTTAATGSPNGDKLYAAKETAGGNIVAVGVSNFASGQTNSFIVLLNASGTLVWSRISSYSSADEFMAINQLPNGNLIVAGFYNAGTFYRLTVFEINESTAAIVSQNNYNISTTIPGVPFTINSIWPNGIFIRNGAVIIRGVVFQNFGSAAYPIEWTYNQTTKNLSGNIGYHTGATNSPSALFYPITDQDFMLLYYTSASPSPFISRITNNVVVYDRQLNVTNPTLSNMDVLNTDLLLTGTVSSNGYELTSNISFPLSTTPCNITTANTLVLQASNLTATSGTPVVLNVTNPVSSAPLTSINTNTITNTLCGCLLINITAQPTDATVCAGSNASFGVTAANTSGYQWQESTNGGANWNNISNGGVYSGANTTTLSLTGVTAGMNNYQYRCVLTSSCDNSTSAVATLFVTPSVTPTISITESANPICTGTSVTFTANITNGGTTPVYQWKKNGVNVGTNSPTYIDNTLINGDVITCVLTSNAGCLTTNTATSNSIAMVVSATVVASASIVASANPICSGTSVTFTATPTNGGAAPAYQWTKNGINVGTNSPIYTDNTLVNGDVIRCILTSNANCVTGSPATSNGITMNVTASVTPTISVTASANPICTGTSVTFTANITNGGAAPAYQWKKNGVNVGTNSATYTDNALANGDVINCILISNASCVTANPVTSNNITMTVGAQLTPSISIAASANPICTGTSVTFTATPVNGGSSPAYQWTKNGLNVGTNSNTYTDLNLNNGDVVRCILTSSLNCAAPSTAQSNSIIMAISSAPANLRYPTVTAFPYQNLQLQARSIGGTSFQWLPNVGLSNNAISNPVFYYSQSQEYTIRINTGPGCIVIDTQLVEIKGKKGIYVPRGFTPNGDGNNDRLYPILIGIKQLNYFMPISIGGNLIFETTSGRPEDGWNGTYKGKKQPVETYTWVAEGIDIDNITIRKNGNTLLIQ